MIRKVFLTVVVLTLAALTCHGAGFKFDDELFIPLSIIQEKAGIEIYQDTNSIKMGDSTAYLNKYYASRGGELISLDRPIENVGGEILVPESVLAKLCGVYFEYDQINGFIKTDTAPEARRKFPDKRGGIKPREQFPQEEYTLQEAVDFNTISGEEWQVQKDGTLFTSYDKRHTVIANNDVMRNYAVGISAIGNSFGIVGRATDERNCYEVCYTDGKGYINKYTQGSKTALANFHVIWNGKRPLDIKVIFDNADIKVYVDGGLRCSYTDTNTPLLSGKYGITATGETSFLKLEGYVKQ